MSKLKDRLETPHPWLIPTGGVLTKEQSAILNKTSVLIAVPMYGGMCYGTFASCTMDLALNMHALGMTFGKQFLYNESLIQRARNTLTAMFEKGDYEYMLFIDADISFEPKAALEMILASKIGGHKFIGASYPLKTINWDGVRKAIAAGVPNHHLWHCAGQHVVRFKEGETMIKDYLSPIEVRYLATGFMLIHRDVLMAVRKTEYAFKINQKMPGLSLGEIAYSYFDCKTDEKGEYLSEDYLFSKRCIEVCVKPMLRPWVHLMHSGTIVFEGCLACSSGAYAHAILSKKNYKA